MNTNERLVFEKAIQDLGLKNEFGGNDIRLNHLWNIAKEFAQKEAPKEFCQNFGRCNCTDGWNCK